MLCFALVKLVGGDSKDSCGRWAQSALVERVMTGGLGQLTEVESSQAKTISIKLQI